MRAVSPRVLVLAWADRERGASPTGSVPGSAKLPPLANHSARASAPGWLWKYAIRTAARREMAAASDNTAATGEAFFSDTFTLYPNGTIAVLVRPNVEASVVRVQER